MTEQGAVRGVRGHFNRRRFLSGASAGAVCVAFSVTPALAAFPPNDFVDPGGLAQRYLEVGLEHAPTEIEILGYRIEVRAAAAELLGLLADGIRVFRNSKPSANGPPLYAGEIPDTGSAVINGLLQAVTAVSPVAGIAAAVIDMDVKLNEINAKLDVVNAKIDRVIAEIAALREQIDDDAVLRALKLARNDVNAHIKSFRFAKSSMSWRIANVAKARKELSEAQTAAREAEALFAKARGSDARRSAKKSLKTSRSQSENLRNQFESAVTKSAIHARDAYIPELRRLQYALREKALALMGYTLEEERAQLSIVAPVIAMALATLKAIYVELGLQSYDFDPVIAEFDSWIKIAGNVKSARSISRAANKYDVYRLQHEMAAAKYCPGPFVDAFSAKNKTQEIHIAYAEIRRKTRRKFQIAKDDFAFGVFWWASLKRGADVSARTLIELHVTPEQNEAKYDEWLPDYQKKTCQTDHLEKISGFDPDRQIEKLIKTLEKRPSLRKSFEEYRLWRAHIFAADDARAERHYLESLTELLVQSLDLARV